MDFYFTTADVLKNKDKKLTQLLAAKKKTGTLVIFYTKDAMLTFPEFVGLFDSAKRSNLTFQFTEITSPEDVNLEIGIFIGEHGRKENYFLLFGDTSFSLPTSGAYTIKNYEGKQPTAVANVAPKRKPRTSKTEAKEKETKDMKRPIPKPDTVPVQMIEPDLQFHTTVLPVEEAPAPEIPTTPIVTNTSFAGLDEGDRYLFKQYFPLSTKDLRFSGTEEEMINAVAGAISASNATKEDLTQLLRNTFDEEAVAMIIEKIESKIAVLKNIVR